MKFPIQSNFQLLIILGVAFTGVAAFVNTYDAAAQLDQKYQQCEQSPELQQVLQTRFIVMMTLSCIALVVGIILGFVFRSHANQHQVITYGLALGGLFGVIYTGLSKVSNQTGNIRLAFSWVGLVIFVILGIFLSFTGRLGSTTHENVSYNED
jgi:hypothetical protein